MMGGRYGSMKMKSKKTEKGGRNGSRAERASETASRLIIPK